MPSTKNILGACAACGAPREFPAEHLGQTARCPFCRREAELILARPEREGPVPRRVVVRTTVGILILLFGLGSALLALKQAERWAAQHRDKAALSARP